jgi:hypothetical protein
MVVIADIETTVLVNCAWMEGTRSFDIMFGAITSAVCLSVAVPMLWWVLPKHARWYFSPAIDPNRRLQFAYGLFAMSMAFTDALCRFIPHPLFAWVHPAFFLTTILIAVGLGPRVAFLLRAQ